VSRPEPLADREKGLHRVRRVAHDQFKFIGQFHVVLANQSCGFGIDYGQHRIGAGVEDRLGLTREQRAARDLDQRLRQALRGGPQALAGAGRKYRSRWTFAH